MSVTSPHFVIRHTEGAFAGRLEHFFPVPDVNGVGPSFETLRRARSHGLKIAMRGNLTGKELLVPAADIQCL